MPKKKAKKAAKAARKGKSAAPPAVLADAVRQPISRALQECACEALGTALSAPVVSVVKTLGEAFTGGRSTPVYDVVADAAAGQTLMVAKLVELDDDAYSRFKAESYHVEAEFYRGGAAAWLGHSTGLALPTLVALERDDPVSAAVGGGGGGSSGKTGGRSGGGGNSSRPSNGRLFMFLMGS